MPTRRLAVVFLVLFLPTRSQLQFILLVKSFMRGVGMIFRGYSLYLCDDCRVEFDFFMTRSFARHMGWSISSDRCYCWCPKCAVNHKRGRPRKKDVVEDE